MPKIMPSLRGMTLMLSAASEPCLMSESKHAIALNLQSKVVENIHVQEKLCHMTITWAEIMAFG